MKDAVEDDYFFEMFIDELPMWAYVGEVVHEEFLLGKNIQGSRVYIYPHLAFSIGFNGDQIVSVNVTTDPSRRIDVSDEHVGQEVSYFLEFFNMFKYRKYYFYVINRSFFLILWSGFINLKFLSIPV